LFKTKPLPSLHVWQRGVLSVAEPRLRASLSSSWDGGKTLDSFAVVAATGAGKSIAQAALLLKVLEAKPDARVVVTVPSKSLVEQLASTLREYVGPVGMFYSNKKDLSRITVCCMASFGALTERSVLHGLRYDLLLADECHKTEAGVYKDTLAQWPARVVVGFTATPFRSGDERLTLFSEVVFTYSRADAERDGVLVPLVWESWGDRPNPEAEEDQDAQSINDDRTIEMIREKPVFPMVCGSASKAHAERLATKLHDAGYRVGVVHSGLSKTVCDQQTVKLKTGELQIVVHVAILAEGVDFPWLRSIVLRHFSAAVRLVQTIGRVARVDRENPAGKPFGLILDPENLYSTARARAAAVGEEEPAGLNVERMAPARVLSGVQATITLYGPDMRGVSVQLLGEPVQLVRQERRAVSFNVYRSLPDGVDEQKLSVFAQRGPETWDGALTLVRAMEERETKEAIATGAAISAGNVAIACAYLFNEAVSQGLIDPPKQKYPKTWAEDLAPYAQIVGLYSQVDLNREVIAGPWAKAWRDMWGNCAIQVKSAAADMASLLPMLKARAEPWTVVGGLNMIPKQADIENARAARLNEDGEPVDIWKDAGFAASVMKAKEARKEASRQLEQNSSPDCLDVFLAMIWKFRDTKPEACTVAWTEGRIQFSMRRDLEEHPGFGWGYFKGDSFITRKAMASLFVQHMRTKLPGRRLVVCEDDLLLGACQGVIVAPKASNPAAKAAPRLVDWSPFFAGALARSSAAR
jgi:superfamily II DNA or RNA helicase